MRYLLTIFFLTAVSTVNAQSEFKVDLKDLDTTKFCVYGQNVYSLGSSIMMGAETKTCTFVSSLGSSTGKSIATWQ